MVQSGGLVGPSSTEDSVSLALVVGARLLLDPGIRNLCVPILKLPNIAGLDAYLIAYFVTPYLALFRHQVDFGDGYLKKLGDLSNCVGRLAVGARSGCLQALKPPHCPFKPVQHPWKRVEAEFYST